MFISQFVTRSGRAQHGAPTSMSDVNPVLAWLELALNSRMAGDMAECGRYEYVKRSVLTFGNGLFLMNMSDLENAEILKRSVKELMSRVAPGVIVLSVERQQHGGNDPEFQLKFVMRLDLSRLGGPREAKVGAMFAVSSQRAQLVTA